MCSHKLHLKFRGGRQRLQWQDPERTAFPSIIHSWDNLCPCTEQIPSPWLLSFLFLCWGTQRDETYPSWGDINNFTLLQESEGRLWWPDFQNLWEASRRNIFKDTALPLSHLACLSDKYARACFVSGARVSLAPSFQGVCLSLSWNLCSSLYKGPMLLLSKMQT